MNNQNKRYDSVQVGEELPVMNVSITVPLIAGGAIATRDYFPGHHDKDAARALGSPDIFMNILTTSGLVQSFVDSWSGPDAHLLDIKIKLGAPNYPGDTMKFTGSVTEKNDAKRSVTLAIKGANSMGSHVSGTVQVQLP